MSVDKAFVEELRAVVREVMKPAPRITLSEWADTYRMISPEAAAEPGKWRTDRTPYARDIMDAISDKRTREVVVMSGAQIAKTEILLNTIGYYVHYDPCPILLLEPTVDLATTISKTRVAPMIRDMPELRDKVAAPKSRDSANTTLEKLYKGGSLTLAGANSPNSLASRPIRVLLVDELDRMPLNVVGPGGSEGDAFELAKQRTANFYTRKIVSVSTPTVKGVSRIELNYEEGTQGRYNVSCVLCDALFEPKWSMVKWDKGENGEHLPHTATLECPHCTYGHNDAERYRASAEGMWVHRFPNREKKSFHLTALVSPWARLKELVQRWLTAQKSNELRRTFMNTVLGESYEDLSSGISHLDFMSRREDYTVDAVPLGVEIITMGVDTQDDRYEVTAVGWGMDDESWMLSHTVVHGVPSAPDTKKRLSDELLRTFIRVDGAPLRAQAVCIDSGGSYTQAVYAFCRENRIKRWWATKGMPNRTTNYPLFPSRATTTKKGKVYIVGVDTGKNLIYSWLRQDKPGPEYVHFPMSADVDYFEQLTSERVKKEFRNGYAHLVWFLPKKARNEALDCYVLAAAARAGLRVKIEKARAINKKAADNAKERRDTMPDETIEVNPVAERAKEKQTRVKRKRRRSGYMGGFNGL